MRLIFSAGFAATLLGSAALGASVDTPLPAGKPAGTKAAQLDVTDTAVVATTAAILVTAVALGATQEGHTASANTTSASASTSTSP